jgi:hypothetical protein
MEMYPPPMKCPPKVYNLWNGFAVERMKVKSSGNVEPFLKHIKLCVNHDANGEIYLIKWLAQLIQQPGKIVGTAPVVRGSQGTGKNALWDDTMRLLLGDDKFYQTANPTQKLFSRFSNGRFRRFLICVDETKSKDSIANSEDMKNAITSKTYEHEIKGIDPMTCLNHNRFVFISNNDYPVKIEEGDRRYFIFTMSGEMFADKAYFDAYYEYIENESNLKAIHEYLMGIDISNVNWISDRPITSAYKDIQTLYIDLVYQFLINVVLVVQDAKVQYSSSDWHKRFSKWCFNNEKGKNTKGESFVVPIDEVRFGIKMGRLAEDVMSGVVKSKSSSTIYTIDTMKLKEYFDKRKILDLDYHFTVLPFMAQCLIH